MPAVWWEATSQHTRHQKGWTVLGVVGDDRMPTNVIFCPFCGVSLPERPGV